LAQAQPTQAHSSHVQNSPLQSGQAQTTQPQPDLAVDDFDWLVTLQQDFSATTGEAEAAAVKQPQLPHVHSSQVQNSPLQSGH